MSPARRSRNTRSASASNSVSERPAMRATVLAMNPEKPSAPSWKRVAATSVSASSRTLMRPVIMSSRMNAVAEKPARSVRSRSKKAATCRPDESRRSALIGGVEEHQLAVLGVVLERHGIATGEAGVAEAALLPAEKRVHALLAEIRQRVGGDVTADLFDVVRRSDELAAIRGVDAVVAGARRRRRADPHVHLARAGVADHLHDLAAGRAAHDRVVDDDDALPGEHLALGVELHLDAEV